MSAPTFASTLDHVYALAQTRVHPDLLERLEHAYKLASTDQVQPQGPDHWAVQGSQPTPYRVTHGATWQCSCQDAMYHPHQSCKHIFAAQLWTRAQQALAAAQMVAEEEDARTEAGRNAPVEVIGSEHVETLPSGMEVETHDATVTLPTPSKAVSTTALPEAPASVNCHITIEGRQVQLTLRDACEARLLERLATILRQYPAPTRAPASQGEGKLCPIHQVPMKENTKEGRTWWSHRHGEGWCKGK